MIHEVTVVLFSNVSTSPVGGSIIVPQLLGAITGALIAGGLGYWFSIRKWNLEKAEKVRNIALSFSYDLILVKNKFQVILDRMEAFPETHLNTILIGTMELYPKDGMFTTHYQDLFYLGDSIADRILSVYSDVKKIEELRISLRDKSPNKPLPTIYLENILTKAVMNDSEAVLNIIQDSIRDIDEITDEINMKFK